jgi:hypothetical protein
MNKKNKRGQITIFVIIAIIIIALAFAIYYFYPQIRTTITGQTLNPSSYLQGCIEEELNSALESVSAHGGSINPEHYILYQNQNIEYLCYTNEYYKTCVMQQPLLKRHIEQEVTEAVSGTADECLNSLVQSYTKQGYDVELKKGNVSLELLPKRAVLYFNSALTLKKENSQRYTDLRVSVTNNLYELVSIATSILNFETTYGDSETTIYMNYYHDLKVEKLKQEEGSKIYILTDRNNGNKFQFATRSIAWPPAV